MKRTRALYCSLLWVLTLVLLAPSLSAEPVAVATDKPSRIASLNLCTDQLLLMLVEPERIVSVTHLAADPAYSYTWQQAAHLPQNSGLAEQVLPLQPDLILTAPYSPGSAVQLFKQLGYHTEVIDLPANLQQVESFVMRIGELVHEPERARLLIQHMRESITHAQQNLRHNPSSKALIYAPNGHTAGSGSLKHDILQAAGFHNLAAELGVKHYGNLSVEQLLQAQPDVVILDDSSQNQHSLAQRYTHHPALVKALGKSRLVTVASNQWLCAGPMAADAIATLAQVSL